MLKIVLIVGVLLFNLVGVQAKEMDSLDNLVKKFEANPADPKTTIQLLRELKNQGKPNRDVVNRYFQTQKEVDYLKDYNWSIIRDYVDDVNAPQIKYLFNNKFIISLLYCFITIQLHQIFKIISASRRMMCSRSWITCLSVIWNSTITVTRSSITSIWIS